MPTTSPHPTPGTSPSGTSPSPEPPTSTHSGIYPLVTVARTGSTQDDLRAALTGPQAAQWPHLSALRALSQTAGRGRAGNAWHTPAEGALTVSVVLRPLVPANRLPWLPLLAGLAVRDALAPLAAPTPWRLGTKWPNDVVALPGGGAPPEATAPSPPSGAPPPSTAPDPPPGEAEESAEGLAGWGSTRKLAGILAELVTPGAPPPELYRPGQPPGSQVPTSRERAPVVILGLGVNVAQDARHLPVPWATSLRLLGARTTPGDALALIGRHLAQRLAQWEALRGDPHAGTGRLGRHLRAACATLGQEVSVQTPTGPLRGTAVDADPALVLRTAEGLRRLQAGDVRLVRAGAGHRARTPSIIL